jgi:hypothetical protein
MTALLWGRFLLLAALAAATAMFVWAEVARRE